MSRRRFQVPVMVTVEVEAGAMPPDSADVASVLHETLFNTFEWDGIAPEVSEQFAVQSIDCIQADEEDPNSPPVPAERLMSLDGPIHVERLTLVIGAPVDPTDDGEATAQRETDMADEAYIRDIRGFNDGPPEPSDDEPNDWRAYE